ncbi:hypothetical protein [Dyadobacter sp. CY312]|uniref:hypothetical protein n=1 Tax=Dyadobacter sp. CY312 TaxID=2907303 RepID=UPI001F17D5B0|nr:hypothetical protein [Dyadobacter sp. CY312]MCE7040278.1 hypothetical protein [Dyadobacter sp. CY312]
MKRYFLFLFVTIAALACKKDDPETQINKIAGTWELAAREELAEGKNVWVDVSQTNPEVLVFREDGDLIDVTGLPICCAPRSLSIDGNVVKIAPKQNVLYSAMCMYVNCVYCETWGIETHGDEIIVSYCGMSRTRYIRKDGI